MAEDVSQPPQGATTSLNSPPTTPPPPPQPDDQQHPPRNAPSTTTPQPHDTIPYSSTFTDSLMTHILNPPPRHQPQTTTRKTKQSRQQPDDSDPKAIHIIPPSSDQPTTNTRSTSTNTTTLSAIDPTTLPTITPQDLPLPLDDPRRTYASSIPGIRLTHPGGYLEGGPGPGTSLVRSNPETAAEGQPPAEASPVLPSFAQSFIAENNIRSAADLRTAVSAARTAQVEELKRRMGERQDALRRNERLQREIDELVAERDMERRVHERQMKIRKERMGTGE